MPDVFVIKNLAKTELYLLTSYVISINDLYIRIPKATVQTRLKENNRNATTCSHFKG